MDKAEEEATKVLMKRMKVIRILVIEGEIDWVETTLRTSHISPDKPLDLGISGIKEIFRMEEVIEIDNSKYEVSKGGDKTDG